MLVKLNINDEVYKDIYSFNFANSKVSIILCLIRNMEEVLL